MSPRWFAWDETLEQTRRAAMPRRTERAPLIDRAIVIVTIALFVTMAVRVALAWHAGTFPG